MNNPVMAPKNHASGNHLEQLRSDTRGVHERLHEHPVLSPLIASHVTLRDYGLVLWAFERFYQNLYHAIAEQTFALASERLRLIREDLIAIRFANNPLPECTYLQYGPSHDELLGVQYVIIGSSLGGTMIARNIEARLGYAQGRGSAYFGSSPETIKTHWKTFQDRLAHECVSIDATCHAALLTFEGLEQWLWDVLAKKDGLSK
jgi:heme oxygenase